MLKKVISKQNWSSNFTLVGEAKVNDFTFKIDKHSEQSKWIYNSLNLGVDCGEKNGTIYCELMGGYSAENINKIYAHGKKDDGSDDFENRIEIDWDDRFDESICETIGNMCFITVGLEKTNKGKTFYKKFLSQYDAIAYIKEHLVDGMVVNVKGNIKYSMYNDNIIVKKNITSIVLSSVDDKNKYKASFLQTILIDKDSATLKNDGIDKDKGVLFVNARVLDYVKEYNGVEVKGQFPFGVTFEYPMDFTKADICKKIMNKLFKIKKDITQITFEGEFIEGGATIQTTLDDIPDEIRELIECGVYTEEEALVKCSVNGNRERRMILNKPYIKIVGDEEKIPVIQRIEEAYTEDDLYLDYVYSNAADIDNTNVNNKDIDNKIEDDDKSSENDLEWLNAL